MSRRKSSPGLRVVEEGKTALFSPLWLMLRLVFICCVRAIVVGDFCQKALEAENHRAVAISDDLRLLSLFVLHSYIVYPFLWSFPSECRQPADHLETL